jgi:hypothetical protein
LAGRVLELRTLLLLAAGGLDEAARRVGPGLGLHLWVRGARVREPRVLGPR